MVSVVPLVPQPVPQPIGERRLFFHSLDWQRYQTLRETLSRDRGASPLDNRNIRFTYLQGKLEVTIPLEIHEFSARLIEKFIWILVVEYGLKVKTMGSTTLDRESLGRSAEPDNAYYIQNQPLVAGRDVDLDQDPPPDLVVEVDITHTDIDKLDLYAAMNIPEFWRYNGEVWRIYTLRDRAYQEVEASPTFPQVPKLKLYEFLATARQDEVEAELALRQWVRELSIKTDKQTSNKSHD
ncbi:Uma2 family endonuclease [Oscillatoria sp. CS-180]|uniref:Uma2 family endonuclease n=1 Tax=Oscillatoria sp. CS-180 TaxID=3021720 RepID=UPI00232C862F|nr:Uma2 family endonuclease [Oscillatoria sp. CS-180]MDB9525977.1 Uma2 family endonuclease [Oscillatoria sp. CS-180]